ncbi:MAG: hypothetical protein JWM10_1249 [Myxococcaceae bacterium]|nr:hypothetical protein [Myxococcaceae bacterium]
MSTPRLLGFAFTSVSLFLAGCGNSPAPTPVDSGAADVGFDVPAAPADVPRVDAGTPLVLQATLTGRELVPPSYTSAATGTVTFTINAERTLAQYSITHSILLPTATRLYLGLAGEAGAMQLSLTNNGGTTIGTTGLTPDQVRALTEGRMYVQINSGNFPDGELRGQLVLPGESVYAARLSPEQENPPATATSSGVAQFMVDPTANRVRYVVRTTGLMMPATLSHIHTAVAGANGAVLIDLATAGVALTDEFTGSRPVPAGTISDLEAGRWYVNVHSAAFPAGEIRGQILRPGERMYYARLTGAEEVPPSGSTATGSVQVIVSANRNSLAYEGAVAGVTPTAAHLHAGAVGANGEVVQGLTLTGMNLRGNATLTATGDAGVPLLTGLAAGTIYANVHSAMFPNGEIRGQLRAAPVGP